MQQLETGWLQNKQDWYTNADGKIRSLQLPVLSSFSVRCSLQLFCPILKVYNSYTEQYGLDVQCLVSLHITQLQCVEKMTDRCGLDLVDL